MRISKSPAERKQEIMDTAMHVFAEKGYEQTTIRDIAKIVGVVPGLCYRYFPSKEDLFEAALQNYATECCKPLITLLHLENTNLDDLLSEKVLFSSTKEGSGDYQTFFHKRENENFHILLSNRICQLMLPHITEFLDQCNKQYHWEISDTRAYAAFYLFGIAALLNEKDRMNSDKATKIRELTYRLMKPVKKQSDK